MIASAHRKVAPPTLADETVAHGFQGRSAGAAKVQCREDAKNQEASGENAEGVLMSSHAV